MNDIEKISAKVIKDIRKNWPKYFGDEHEPPIDSVVVSVELRMPVNDLITKDITIVGPDGTKWDITICGDEVMHCGITSPDLDLIKDFFNKTPVDLSHLEQWGPKLLEPKKVIHRRIILD